MRYPQPFIEDLKRQADIVRVIQDYVQLKKKGANWMACCPFHKEKTASFSVSPSKEIFYCFGCHKGGSVFTFVMEMERVSFPEAIRIVAEKTGMQLPKLVDDGQFDARRQESDDVIEMNKWALEWWEQQLEGGGSESRMGRDYLANRGISDETRKAFRLGYAPDSWEALSTHLRQKGATQLQIERSGLVVKKEEGSSYDRFRGRLIFPVMDVQGRPIAFGGRTLRNDDTAKYINSPETAAYVKGRNLFGLNLTRDEIRRQGHAILVEGFLDLIVPYQHGIRNVVASLGTALTPEQVRLLARFARKVVVNYDGDRAGVQAAKKAIETLLVEDLEVKVLVLPDDADPDEFIRKAGVSEYRRKRAEAQTHIQFIIDQAVRDRNLRNPPDKEAAIEEALPYVLAARGWIQQDEYFEIVMDGLRVPVIQRARYRQRIVDLRRSQRSGSPSKTIVRAPEIELTPAEEGLLRLLLADDQLRRGILPKLKPEDYEDLGSAAVFRALVETAEEVPLEPEHLFEKLENDTAAISQVQKLLMNNSLGSWNQRSRETLFVAGLEAPEKCLDTFRLMKVQRQIDEVRSELADAERAGDTDRVIRLSDEQTELERRRKALQPQTEAATTGI